MDLILVVCRISTRSISQSKVSDESVDPTSRYPTVSFMNGGNEVICGSSKR
jgi:hypothetical protein